MPTWPQNFLTGSTQPHGPERHPAVDLGKAQRATHGGQLEGLDQAFDRYAESLRTEVPLI